MAEYGWPSALRPTRLSFCLQRNTLRFASPITRATQVMRHEGARWMAEASFDRWIKSAPGRWTGCWRR